MGGGEILGPELGGRRTWCWVMALSGISWSRDWTTGGILLGDDRGWRSWSQRASRLGFLPPSVTPPCTLPLRSETCWGPWGWERSTAFGRVPEEDTLLAGFKKNKQDSGRWKREEGQVMGVTRRWGLGATVSGLGPSLETEVGPDHRRFQRPWCGN